MSYDGSMVESLGASQLEVQGWYNLVVWMMQDFILFCFVFLKKYIRNEGRGNILYELEQLTSEAN